MSLKESTHYSLLHRLEENDNLLEIFVHPSNNREFHGMGLNL